MGLAQCSSVERCDGLLMVLLHTPALNAKHSGNAGQQHVDIASVGNPLTGRGGGFFLVA